MILTVTADGPIVDHGTIVVFTGVDEDGVEHKVGVDHRPAQELIFLLDEQPEVVIEAESWQVLGGAA